MQNEEKLMQTFLCYLIYMSFYFLIPQMSSLVSKGISHRIFNIIIIEMKGGKINDKHPVDGTHLISICTKMLVIKSIVKLSATCWNSSHADCWTSASEFLIVFDNFSPIVYGLSFKDAPETKFSKYVHIQFDIRKLSISLSFETEEQVWIIR